MASFGISAVFLVALEAAKKLRNNEKCLSKLEIWGRFGLIRRAGRGSAVIGKEILLEQISS